MSKRNKNKRSIKTNLTSDGNDDVHSKTTIQKLQPQEELLLPPSFPLSTEEDNRPDTPESPPPTPKQVLIVCPPESTGYAEVTQSNSRKIDVTKLLVNYVWPEDNEMKLVDAEEEDAEREIMLMQQQEEEEEQQRFVDDINKFDFGGVNKEVDGSDDKITTEEVKHIKGSYCSSDNSTCTAPDEDVNSSKSNSAVVSPIANGVEIKRSSDEMNQINDKHNNDHDNDENDADTNTKKKKIFKTYNPDKGSSSGLGSNTRLVTSMAKPKMITTSSSSVNGSTSSNCSIGSGASSLVLNSGGGIMASEIKNSVVLNENMLNASSNKCQKPGCEKRPSVLCPACNILVYCTEKHRKASNKNHEPHCNAFRIIEKTRSQPRHAIAARDIEKGGLIMTDEPMLLLPLNPMTCLDNTRRFPLNYCVKCFMMKGDKPRHPHCPCWPTDCFSVCECSMPVCKDVRECESRVGQNNNNGMSHFGAYPSWISPKPPVVNNKPYNPGHVECRTVKEANELLNMNLKSSSCSSIIFINNQKKRGNEDEGELSGEGKKEPEEEEQKKKSLVLDHGVLCLIRTMSVLKLHNPLSHQLEQLFDKAVGGGGNKATYSAQFLNRMYFIRNKLRLGIDFSNDEDLHLVDCGLKRFGRNVGRDIAGFHERNSGLHPSYTTGDGRYVKGVYSRITEVLHSCIPNSILHYSPSTLNAEMTTLKDLKKGDILTVNLDDRCLFMPTWKRRAFLQSEYGITCNCKRCVSPSELDTYFSSFPCSNCPAKKRNNKAYISPTNPGQVTSPWVCSGCKKTSNYLRAVDLIYRIECEINDYLSGFRPDVFGLNAWLRKCAELNLLHSNHYLVFHGCLAMFRALWDLMVKNDLATISQFNKTNGMEFIDAAEILLRLSGIFMPHGYVESMVLPLRLSAIIKLRDLTNKLKQNETPIHRMESIMNPIYNRSDGLLVPMALYDRPLQTQHHERCLKALELKALFELCKATGHTADASKLYPAPTLHKFAMSFYMCNINTRFGKQVESNNNNDSGLFGLLTSDNIKGKVASGFFPWVLQV